MDMGATLRVAREQRGLSLEALSETTKISVTALRALEENDIQKLPGGIFLRGFLRAYAREVGLDVEDTLGRYVSQFEPDPAVVCEGAADLRTTGSRADDARPQVNEVPATALRGVVAVVAIVVGLLLYMMLRQPFARDEHARQPQPAAEPVVARAATTPDTSDVRASTESDTPMTTAVTDTITSATSTTDATGSASSTGTTETTVPPNATAATTGSQEPGAPLQTGDVVRLTIQTVGPCWVSAVADGRTVIYRLMQAGEQQTIEGTTDVTLLVGDPSTFTFSINGLTGRSLGPAGRVAAVQISPDNYQEFVETAPTP
ncbi:MAG: helix-turn-helix domain-containing protein [Vicinamibacterales bacterium]